MADFARSVLAGVAVGVLYRCSGEGELVCP